MELDRDKYLKRFDVGDSKSSEEKELCREIYEWAGKKLNFGMLVVMCRRNGIQCVRECWVEAQKSGGDDPVKIFMWSLKKYGTKFNN